LILLQPAGRNWASTKSSEWPSTSRTNTSNQTHFPNSSIIVSQLTGQLFPLQNLYTVLLKQASILATWPNASSKALTALHWLWPENPKLSSIMAGLNETLDLIIVGAGMSPPSCKEQMKTDTPFPQESTASAPPTHTSNFTRLPIFGSSMQTPLQAASGLDLASIPTSGPSPAYE
jgi:hypothetical protein